MRIITPEIDIHLRFSKIEAVKLDEVLHWDSGVVQKGSNSHQPDSLRRPFPTWALEALQSQTAGWLRDTRVTFIWRSGIGRVLLLLGPVCHRALSPPVKHWLSDVFICGPDSHVTQDKWEITIERREAAAATSIRPHAGRLLPGALAGAARGFLSSRGGCDLLVDTLALRVFYVRSPLIWWSVCCLWTAPSSLCDPLSPPPLLPSPHE